MSEIEKNIQGISIELDPSEPAIPFTMVSNDLIRNKILSLEATALLIRFLSNKEGWVIRMTQLFEEFNGRHGREKIRSIINELIEQGYMKREFITENNLRRQRLFVSSTPRFKKCFPQTGFRGTEFPSTGNPSTENPSAKKDYRQEKTKQEHVMSCAPEGAAPKKGVSSEGESVASTCHKRDKKGNIFTVSKSDLYRVASKERKDWTAEDMNKAWEIFISYDEPISDWWKFLSGLIEKIKNDKGVTQCQSKQQKPQQTNNLKSKSVSDKNLSTGKDTSEPHFHSLKELAKQLGVR